MERKGHGILRWMGREGGERETKKTEREIKVRKQDRKERKKARKKQWRKEREGNRNEIEGKQRRKRPKTATAVKEVNETKEVRIKMEGRMEK